MPSDFVGRESRGGGGRPALELRLGRSIPIVIGSIALVLAGIWLVKVFIDRDLLPPNRRVLLGGAFAVLLIGAAEWCRSRVAPIARALTICGVVVAHATVWAAQRLYALIDPEPALVLLGGTTAAALLLGRRFGRWVTGVGLLGGFSIPALVGPAAYDPLLLFGTLACLQVGLLIDGTVRRHRWFGAIAVTGSFFWYAVWWFETPASGHASLVATLYLFGTTFLAAPEILGGGFGRVSRLVGALVPGWTLALLHFFTLDAELAPSIALAGFAAATVVTAIVRPGAAPVAGAALLPSSVALWATSVHDDRGFYFGGLLIVMTLFVGVPFSLARSDRRPITFWGALATVAAGTVVLLGRFGLPGEPPPGDWSTWLLGASILASAGAVTLGRGRTDPGNRLEVRCFAGLAVAIAAGASFEAFERVDVGVAWSALAVLVVTIAGRAPFRGADTIAALLLVGTGIRVLANPALLEYPIGPHPIGNWIPWGYGVPAIATTTVAESLRRRGRRDFIPFLWGLVIALVVALAYLMVRHAFHPTAGTVFAGGPPGPGEGLAYSITGIVIALALFGASLATGARSLRYAGVAGMTLAIGKVFILDTRNLQDLYRVISYLGLGIGLIGLAWAYHRWVPRIEDRLRRTREGEGAAPTSSPE